MNGWSHQQLQKPTDEEDGQHMLSVYTHKSDATLTIVMDARGRKTVYEAHFESPPGQRVNSISNPVFSEESHDVLVRRVNAWIAEGSNFGLGEAESEEKTKKTKSKTSLGGWSWGTGQK